MSISTLLECAECGMQGDDMYVARCHYCEKPVCSSCAAWLPTKKEINRGVYLDVNRICQNCGPSRFMV